MSRKDVYSKVMPVAAIVYVTVSMLTGWNAVVMSVGAAVLAIIAVVLPDRLEGKATLTAPAAVDPARPTGVLPPSSGAPATPLPEATARDDAPGGPQDR